MPRPTLDARAAIRCARRTHNDFDPTVDDSLKVELEPSVYAEQGIVFEKGVRDHLIALLGGDCIDLTGIPQAEAAVRTLDAMRAGLPVIIGGALPDDAIGGRRGRPDLLIRYGASSGGLPGYLPGDIKSHRIAKDAKRTRSRITRLDNLGDARDFIDTAELPGAASYRHDDLMQLAHYWRMLEACGHAASYAPWGGLIGADDPFLIWQPLDEGYFSTYFRSRGTALRMTLERYDHEFEFRHRLVELALQQDNEDPPPVLVRPILIEE